MLDDIRAALRIFRRHPAFAAMVAGTLAVGIAANTMMIGVLERLLLHPPAHVRHPDELRHVRLGASGGEEPAALASYPVFLALAERLAMVAELAAFHPMRVQIGRGTETSDVSGALVSLNYFALLGTRPHLGRFLSAHEPMEATTRLAVISYRLWQNAYGEDPSAIGRQVFIDGRAYEIIGVAPEGFAGATAARTDVYLSLAATGEVAERYDWRDGYGSTWLHLVARPSNATHVSSVEAQARAVLHAANESSGLPPAVLANTVALLPLSRVIGAERQLEVSVSIALAVLSTALLLAAAANVGFLLLARGLQARGEYAVRIALGATRARIARLVLTETLLLTVLGTLLAFGLLVGAGSAMQALVLRDLAAESHLLGMRTVGVAGVLMLVTIVVAGAPVAFRLATLDISGTIARSRTRLRHGLMRRLLLTTQTAVAMITVAVAWLFARSLANVRAIETGIDLEHVAVAILTLNAPDTAESNRRYRLISEHLRKLPQVRQTSLISRSVPLVLAYGVLVRTPGQPQPPRVPGSGPYYSAVDEAFLSTLGAQVRRGRAILREDIEIGARVGLINEAMVRRRWANADPLGSCVLLGSDSACTTIVGIVQDVVKFRLLNEPEPQMVYVPLTHPFVQRRPLEAVVVRTTRGSADVVPELKRAVATLLPSDARFTMTSYEEAVEPQMRPWRLGATLLGYFGTLTLGISAVGLFALMNYQVIQRRRELSIRKALGADDWRLVGAVTSEGIVAIGAGAVLGAAIVAVAGGLLRTMLYGVAAHEPTLLLGAAGSLMLIGIGAAAVPIIRATRVPPSETLRFE